MLCTTFLTFDPSAQAAVERLEVTGIVRGEQLGADGFEPALDFPLALGPVRTGMDQRDAEFGAHQRQMPGTVIGAVVDVKAFTVTPSQNGLLEDRQKRPGVLRMRKGGIGDDPRGIIDKPKKIS